MNHISWKNSNHLTLALWPSLASGDFISLDIYWKNTSLFQGKWKYAAQSLSGWDWKWCWPMKNKAVKSDADVIWYHFHEHNVHVAKHWLVLQDPFMPESSHVLNVINKQEQWVMWSIGVPWIIKGPCTIPEGMQPLRSIMDPVTNIFSDISMKCCYVRMWIGIFLCVKYLIKANTTTPRLQSLIFSSSNNNKTIPPPIDVFLHQLLLLTTVVL